MGKRGLSLNQRTSQELHAVILYVSQLREDIVDVHVFHRGMPHIFQVRDELLHVGLYGGSGVVLRVGVAEDVEQAP